MSSEKKVDSDNQRLAIKIDLLRNEYNELKSHIQLLHRQSITLAMLVIPVLLWVADA